MSTVPYPQSLSETPAPATDTPEPVGRTYLRDRFAFAFWLGCAAVLAWLMLSDLFRWPYQR
jgi:hypothetical protein